MASKRFSEVKNKSSIQLLMPDTAREFSCIMGDCEDNCCRNNSWKISIDAESYKKYQGLDGEAREKILDCIDDSGNALIMRQFDDGKCPLMTDEGLCYIHKELGVEYLSQTCAVYPRIYSSKTGRAEYWLTLSCPEVVRHVLYRKKGISFVESNFVSSAVIPKPKPFDNEKALVRDLLAKILAYRKLTIKEKLLYMAMCMRSISKLDNSFDYARSFRKTIKNYGDGLRDARKSLRDVITGLGSLQKSHRISMLSGLAQLACAAATPPKMHPKGIGNENYYRLMANFNLDIMSGKVTTYICDAFDRLIVSYINSKPYLFENYLTYSLMSTEFLSETDNFARAYAGFAGEFATMLVFACMFHEQDVFGDEEMVAAIYLFHRIISHNKQLRKALIDKFADNTIVFLIYALGGVN